MECRNVSIQFCVCVIFCVFMCVIAWLVACDSNWGDLVFIMHDHGPLIISIREPRHRLFHRQKMRYPTENSSHSTHFQYLIPIFVDCEHGNMDFPSFFRQSNYSIHICYKPWDDTSIWMVFKSMFSRTPFSKLIRFFLEGK